MMTYNVGSADNKTNFAEVFTPAGVVFEMLYYVHNDIADIDKTIFDPALGEGQFPCAELVLKMFYNVERLDEDLALRALRSLYGVDIQAASVTKAHDHLLLTLQAAYKFFAGNDFTRLDEAREIIAENFYQGDSIKLMKAWNEPQGSLF